MSERSAKILCPNCSPCFTEREPMHGGGMGYDGYVELCPAHSAPLEREAMECLRWAMLIVAQKYPYWCAECDHDYCCQVRSARKLLADYESRTK